MAQQELFDVTVVGGGPIGLFTAFYSGMRNLKTKIIESSMELGGKITMFYPEKTIRDIGGIPAIKGKQLVNQLMEQVATFEPTIIYGQFINDLERLSNGIMCLTSSTGEVHYTKTIILAVGHGIFKPMKLEINGAERYESTNLHYSVDELNVYKGKRVLISGGGNSAVDWATELTKIAESVMVIHRRDEFGAHEVIVTQMKEQAMVLTPFVVKELHGEEDVIKKVTIENVETGESRILEIDELVINHGIKGDYGGINGWGLAMNEERIMVNSAMETNIPGIFAVGDAVTYPNKLKLIAGGFTEGPVAINSAAKFLQPNSLLVDLYSTYHEKWEGK